MSRSTVPPLARSSRPTRPSANRTPGTTGGGARVQTPGPRNGHSLALPGPLLQVPTPSSPPAASGASGPTLRPRPPRPPRPPATPPPIAAAAPREDNLVDDALGIAAEPLKTLGDGLSFGKEVRDMQFGKDAGKALGTAGDTFGMLGNAATAAGGLMTFIDGSKASQGSTAAEKNFGRGAMFDGGREFVSSAMQTAGNIGSLAGSEMVPFVGDIAGAINDTITAGQAFGRAHKLRGAADTTGDAVAQAKAGLKSRGDRTGDKKFAELTALQTKAYSGEADTQTFESLAKARSNPAHRDAIQAGQIDGLRGDLAGRQGFKGGLATASAVGNTLSAVGTLTAAGDGGATKAAGVGIKAGVGGIKLFDRLRQRWQGASDAVQAKQLVREAEGKEKQGALSAFGSKLKGFFGLGGLRESVGGRLGALRTEDTGAAANKIGARDVNVGTKAARNARYDVAADLLRDRGDREADLLVDAAGGGNVANAKAADKVMSSLGMIDSGERGALQSTTAAGKAAERAHFQKNYSRINQL